MKLTLIALIAVCVMAGACGGDDSPSSPSFGESLSGTWAGTTTSATTGSKAFPFRLTLTHTGATINGTWAAASDFDSGGGTAAGTVNASTVALTLRSDQASQCVLNVTASVAGARMTGTYATVGCFQGEAGTLGLTKE
jgi:hypothetical protein